MFVDPRSLHGILFFNPRWAIQFLPQDRLTCVIDKRINSPALFKAIYNGVLLMPESATRKPGAVASLRPQLGLPPAARRPMLLAVPALAALSVARALINLDATIVI